MKIDRQLNLVIPVERDDGATIYVHSTPISEDIFNRYFLVISKAFSAIHAEGIGAIAGPRVALLMLKRAAAESGDAAAQDVEQGLISEMRRLTNVAVPGANGWETLPLEEAEKRGAIDAADVSEVENALAFFTVGSVMYARQVRRKMLDFAMSLWGGHLESSNCTAFVAGLPTLTKVENSGASITLQVPS